MLFAPEDLALVKGDPAERRRFLDDLLVLRAPRLAGVRADYDRVLKQRNSLLKTAGARAAAAGVSEARRCRRSRSGTPTWPGPAPSCSPRGWSWSTTLRPYVGKAYETVARGATRDDAEIDYKPSSTRSTASPRPGAASRSRGAARSQRLLAELERRERRARPRRVAWSVRTATTWCSARLGTRPAGQGLRQPRRVVVVRARAAAGVVRPAARATATTRS